MFASLAVLVALSQNPQVVVQGRGIDGTTSWSMKCTSGCSGSGGSFTGWMPDGGSIGYMRMPDGGPLEVTVTSGGSGGSFTGWFPDGGFIGTVGLADGGGVVVTNTVTVTGTVTANAGTGTMAVSAATLPLPTGASTSALQTTGNTSLSSIDTKTPALGQGLMAASVPVTIASNQSAVPVSGTVTSNAGTGTMTVGQATGTNLHTVIDNTVTVSGTVTANVAGTVPVSAVALPLPSGAATETTLARLPIAQSSTLVGTFGVLSQGAVTTAAPTYTTGVTNPLSLNLAGGLRVDGSGVTQPVSAATLPLPSGAMADATFTGRINTQGQKTMAASTPVVLASDQSAIPVTLTSTTVTGTVLARPTKAVFTPTPSAVSCGTTATAAPASLLTNRTTLTLVNNSSAVVYIGGSGVTTATGVPLQPGAVFSDDVGASPYYCIVASGTADVRALEN